MGNKYTHHLQGNKESTLVWWMSHFHTQSLPKKTTNKRQNKTNIFSKNARLFNVTFLFPRFRSLNLYKRHSTITKRSQILAQYQVFVKHKLITFFLVGVFNPLILVKFQHLPRVAKWFLKGFNSPPFRV